MLSTGYLEERLGAMSFLEPMEESVHARAAEVRRSQPAAAACLARLCLVFRHSSRQAALEEGRLEAGSLSVATRAVGALAWAACSPPLCLRPRALRAERSDATPSSTSTTKTCHDRCLEGRRRRASGLVSQPLAHPEVSFGGVPMRAAVISDEAERQRIWKLADRVFAPYAVYRREAAAASRTIPIVQLSAR